VSNVLPLAPVEGTCAVEVAAEGCAPLVGEKVWVLANDEKDGVLVDDCEEGVLVVGEDEVEDCALGGGGGWTVDVVDGVGGVGGGALELIAKIVASACPSAREKVMKPELVQQSPTSRFLSQQYTPLPHRRIASLPAAVFPYVQI